MSSTGSSPCMSRVVGRRRGRRRPASRSDAPLRPCRKPMRPRRRAGWHRPSGGSSPMPCPVRAVRHRAHPAARQVVCAAQRWLTSQTRWHQRERPKVSERGRIRRHHRAQYEDARQPCCKVLPAVRQTTRLVSLRCNDRRRTPATAPTAGNCRHSSVRQISMRRRAASTALAGQATVVRPGVTDEELLRHFHRPEGL
jgi:hypothetical protein